MEIKLIKTAVDLKTDLYWALVLPLYDATSLGASKIHRGIKLRIQTPAYVLYNAE